MSDPGVAIDAPAIEAPAADTPVVGERLVDELFAATGEVVPDAVLGSGRAIERTADGARLSAGPVPVAPVGSGSAGGVGSAAVQILVLAAFVIAAALLAQMHSSIVEHDSDALRSAAPLIPGFSPD